MDVWIDQLRKHWKGYDRDQRKYYRAVLMVRTERHSMRLLWKKFRRAQDAEEYAQAIVERYERLLRAMEPVEIDPEAVTE